MTPLLRWRAWRVTMAASRQSRRNTTKTGQTKSWTSTECPSCWMTSSTTSENLKIHEYFQKEFVNSHQHTPVYTFHHPETMCCLQLCNSWVKHSTIFWTGRQHTRLFFCRVTSPLKSIGPSLLTLVGDLMWVCQCQCQCHGQFHTIHLIEGKASRRIHVVRRRLTKRQATSRPDLCPEIWRNRSIISKMKEKQHWVSEKPNSKTPEDYEVFIYFVEYEDEEFKDQECTEKVGSSRRTCYAL